MKIQQTTLDKIKAYILDTQKNSTYNSAPHEPLEMCWNPNVAYQWNLCNCYCYLNRYLATEGEKRSNIKDLLKCCHYAWFECVRNDYASDFEGFKECIINPNYINKFISYSYINSDLIAFFKADNEQVINEFWICEQYLRLAILLIQQHLETNHIDLETT